MALLFRHRKWLWLCLATVLIVLASTAIQTSSEAARVTGTTGTLLSDEGPVNLGPALAWYPDPEAELTLSDVRALVATGEMRQQDAISPHFGYSPGPVWLHVTLRAGEDVRPDWVVELNHPLFREIDAWLIDGLGRMTHFRGGHSVPASEWPINHRVFAFPVEASPGETLELYLRLAGDSSLQAPLLAWSERAFLEERGTVNIWLGFTYGLVFALLAYNLLLYFGLRDANYIYYVAYVASLLLALLTVHGVAYQYLWPWASHWAHAAAPTLGAFGHIAALAFARSFLQMPGRMPRTDRWLMLPLIVLLALIALLALGGGARLANQIITPLLVAVTVVLFTVGVVSWRQGLVQARYFVLAWTVLLAGVSLYSLRAMGVVPNVFITEYGLMLGAWVELLLLSFALAHRMRLVQEERETIQARAEKALYRRAYEDQITRLPNRRYLQESLQELVAQAGPASSHGLIMLEPDRFHVLLEGRGYKAGDRLLRLLGSRLSRITRELDDEAFANVNIVGRFSGPIFAILLADVDKAAMTLFVERLSHTLNEPIRSQGREYHFDFNIACTLFPHDGGDAQTLFRNARAALSFGEQQTNGTVWFSEAMRGAAEDQLEMEEALRMAVALGEFEMCYQPVIDLKTGQMSSMEALVRWHHNGRLISPDEFIPVAESAGLISDIGRWLMEQVCWQILNWRHEGVPVPPVAVNISAVQFSHPDFVTEVCSAVRAVGIDPADMELEITETAAMDQIEPVLERMQALREEGFVLVMDDFGTGHSSMAHLQRFPIQKVKIDRNFIQALDAEGPESAIAERILELAHAMGLRCVAEGVETREQLELLKEMGCDYAQGFYFTAAVTSNEIPALNAQGFKV